MLLLLSSLLLLVRCSHGFSLSPMVPDSRRRQGAPQKWRLGVGSNDEDIVTKTERLLQQQQQQGGPLPFDADMDAMVRSVFSDTILSNPDFMYRVVTALAARGCTAANTLFVTSHCSDELARQLAQDYFAPIFGSPFQLGGLAGFPFAGNIGYATMATHIPEPNGHCLLLYGPHVGVTADGVVGQVERAGVSQQDSCCRSAMEACQYVLQQQRQGEGTFSSAANDSTMMFTDLQQGAVQNLMTPLADRLQASEYPQLELPYAIYETQTELVESLVSDNDGLQAGGIVLLGGIQINTGPQSLDYFLPLRFDWINGQGEWVEDLLPELS